MDMPLGASVTSYEALQAKSRRRKLSLSLQGSAKASEHLPSINCKRHQLQKYVFLSLFLLANFAIIIMSTRISKYYWVIVPIIMFRPFVDVLEITFLIFFYLTRRAYPVEPKVPDTPENLAYLLACYNETGAELEVSLNSLVEQRKLETHSKAIVIVCDGRCNGRGMKKTTAEQLSEDIIETPTSTIIQDAYTAWDGRPMDVELLCGMFKGLKVLCIVKKENRGKRDSLILVRSFLLKFNQRDSNLSRGIFSSQLFEHMSNFFLNASINSVEYVVGMDADTRFDQDCVFNLVQTVREGEQIIGVCGQIAADPTTSSPFSIPYLYQNVEYKVGQHRRRLRQNLMTRKVTCLPGCCQLLRVIDETCGDRILGQFGYHPKEEDGLFRTIQSMMSEDRDHVCLILREYPDVQTRQCLAARAYTSVPHSLSVFLSQRRRWTLGPMVSDTLLATRKSTGVTERLAAVSSILNWTITIAMFFSPLVRERLDHRTRYMAFFLATFRNIWDYSVVLSSSRTRLEFAQNLMGSFLTYNVSRFVGAVVHVYTLYYLDDFRWGLMRAKIVAKVRRQSIVRT
ncbi:glycosyltransferase family 2 protein [Didymella exigua CBS 183.55]|uniref:chitin synthase n=1 Tax=Didymella exigua CBS 183.55 TaxID=1150837 RepID=A0A6A5RDZ2_9PLEO|nr:glycosyltransferase family 2 protein [Didymella exigua CBS 183.55]KAF1925619.1 glycosyltransferase family 2 protein [Didymella exigua CBS 183.55]